MFRSLADRVVTRLHRRDEYDSVALRDYFRRVYDIDIGLYSIGAFDRWRVPPGTRIGRYCSIARSSRLLDADHPTSALSTHPYLYLKGFGVVAADRATLVPPIIEDDVWIGHNAIVTPSCHVVGRGAVIGAGAVIMADVPPYAVMTGAPARLVRFRFPPDTISLLEASRWWLLDREALAAAARAAPDFAAAPSRDSAAPFFAALGLPLLPPPPVAAVRGVANAGLAAVLASELPTVDPADYRQDFGALGLDSFALIALRVAVEQQLGRQVPDRDWGALATPDDILHLVPGAAPAAPPGALALPPAATVSRHLTINMPQMALEGLSESWLFKELGDMHWSALTHGLGTASADISDSEGARLYATFTRILIEGTTPLGAFCENEDIALALTASRYGAGMFFGDATVAGPTGTLTARLMTSFSKFGEAGANTSLLKGQPVIPDACAIAALAAPPAFAQEYRERRAATLPPPLFETRYEILPPHDINGVGLLYFAAYPMIADLCAMRHGGAAMLFDYSTIRRDIYYFANAVPDETLVFRLHEWTADARGIRYAATIARASDEKTMAYVETDKAPVIRKIRR